MVSDGLPCHLYFIIFFFTCNYFFIVEIIQNTLNANMAVEQFFVWTGSQNKKQLNNDKDEVRISHYVHFQGHILILGEVIGNQILGKT